MAASLTQPHADRPLPRLRIRSLFAGSLSQLLNPPAKQIPYLDGLRCLAVLLVINHHFSDLFTSVHHENAYGALPFVVNGWSGVDLFFVLSGFFIGGQLWKELQLDRTVHIGRFILRRGYRIWPLYFFVYFVVLITFWKQNAASQYGWADLVFLDNYFNHGIVRGGWSLCTEEQFYIITPLLLFALRKRSNKFIVRVLWGLLALVALLRVGTWIHSTGSFFAHNSAEFDNLYYPFHTHCDGLIIGLILSNLWLHRHKTPPQLLRSAMIVVAGFLSLVLLRSLQHELFIFTGLAFFFGSLVWFGLTSGVQWFRSKPFYWISRLSFGMYLNHPYLMAPILHRFPLGKLAHGNAAIPLQLTETLLLVLLSAAISSLTFCLVEHPFLQLRSFMLARRPEDRPFMGTHLSA